MCECEEKIHRSALFFCSANRIQWICSSSFVGRATRSVGDRGVASIEIEHRRYLGVDHRRETESERSKKMDRSDHVAHLSDGRILRCIDFCRHFWIIWHGKMMLCCRISSWKSSSPFQIQFTRSISCSPVRAQLVSIHLPHFRSPLSTIIRTMTGHLKITLRFLLSLVQQNEFSCRSIFSLIDFKRPCWKSLLKRRDARVSSLPSIHPHIHLSPHWRMPKMFVIGPSNSSYHRWSINTLTASETWSKNKVQILTDVALWPTVCF